MTIQQFSLEFNDSTAFFNPGQVVRGRVTFTCENNYEVYSTGLIIKWEGKAAVNWQTSSYSRSYSGSYGYSPYGGGYGHTTINYRKDFYTGHETYLEGYFYAFGDGIQNMKIYPGDYEYPFEFTLPPGIPATFDCEVGRIWYNVQATIRMPTGQDLETKKDMIVVAIVELNQVPNINQPGSIQYSTMVGKCCCVSGPVGFVLRTNTLGYVPGDIVTVDVSIENNGKNAISLIKLLLVQNFKFHAGGRYKCHDQVLAEAARVGLAPLSSDIWQDQVFQIPPVPPTGLGGGRIIDLQYFLELEMTYMESCGDDSKLKATLPIFIGTVPFTPEVPNIGAPSSEQESHHRSKSKRKKKQEN